MEKVTKMFQGLVVGYGVEELVILHRWGEEKSLVATYLIGGLRQVDTKNLWVVGR